MTFMICSFCCLTSFIFRANPFGVDRSFFCFLGRWDKFGFGLGWFKKKKVGSPSPTCLHTTTYLPSHATIPPFPSCACLPTCHSIPCLPSFACPSSLFSHLLPAYTHHTPPFPSPLPAYLLPASPPPSPVPSYSPPSPTVPCLYMCISPPFSPPFPSLPFGVPCHACPSYLH